ncbi:MAG: sigma-70 family RNA polymerase sigma factor [Gammaproteobacteria bacterium]|nr:sigma-70 family RNA polymerase sigma factor [Gammaproteobacteria bacterium]
MDTLLAHATNMTEDNKRLAETVVRERSRLLNYIRQQVPEPGDAEDILQDVFYELVEAYRLPQPIEQVGAWLFRVARNRIIDRFRKKKPDHSLSEPVAVEDEASLIMLEDLLPSPDAGPEAAYARTVVMNELYAALNELPEEQRDVFIAHELEGRSFKEISEQNGLSINTLLARKRYAVLHLRQRLQAIHDEFVMK